MNHRIIFPLLLLLTFPLIGLTQSKPQVQIQLLSNDQEGDLNLNKTDFSAWATRVDKLIDTVFGLLKSKSDYMLLVTLHPDNEPTLSLFSRPAGPETESEKILERFKGGPSMKTRYVDYSFVYLIRINGGSGELSETFSPEFKDPYILQHESFKRAGLTEKRTLLVNWAASGILPILAESEGKVDEKFGGVSYMGKTLRTALSKDLQVNIPQLTDSSSAYWRGVMEMSPGNEIITLSKVMLLVAQGDFDMAKEYCELLRLFGSKKALASYYTSELAWRLEEFNKELNIRMQRGIEQHDKGNYDGAIAVYTGILNEYPRSAWVHYELYFSTNLRNNAVKKDSVLGLEEWNKVKPVIYSCNPLYPVAARLTTGKDAYLFLRRSELGKLFKDKDGLAKDLIELGDIALDLGATGYAAEVYWLCYSRLKKEDVNHKEMLPYFLYALEKLKVTDIKKNFPGDFEKEFSKIDKERKKRMEQSAAYKAFKVKE